MVSVNAAAKSRIACREMEQRDKALASHHDPHPLGPGAICGLGSAALTLNIHSGPVCLPHTECQHRHSIGCTPTYQGQVPSVA